MSEREHMSETEKARRRPFFATKKAWQRHIARVLAEAREQRNLYPSYADSAWSELDALGDVEARRIRCQWPMRSLFDGGVDFIQHAETLFVWSRKRGKRLYRRAMLRGDLQAVNS